MTTDNAELKTRLLGLLDDARQRMLATLESAPYDRVIYPESGWRVKDILGHITFWEEEAARSLRAYGQGESYTLPDYVDLETSNVRDIEKRKDYSAGQIRADWLVARESLKAALATLPRQLRQADHFFAPAQVLSGGHYSIHEIIAPGDA
jgi:hypothetical protein